MAGALLRWRRMRASIATAYLLLVEQWDRLAQQKILLSVRAGRAQVAAHLPQNHAIRLAAACLHHCLLFLSVLLPALLQAWRSSTPLSSWRAARCCITSSCSQ